MNKKELAEYRARPYSELTGLVDSNPITKEVHVTRETTYQIEISVHWDGDPGENIRVSGAVDDGGLRAFIPICNDFKMAPDNSFVDE